MESLLDGDDRPSVYLCCPPSYIDSVTAIHQASVGPNRTFAVPFEYPSFSPIRPELIDGCTSLVDRPIRLRMGAEGSEWMSQRGGQPFFNGDRPAISATANRGAGQELFDMRAQGRAKSRSACLPPAGGESRSILGKGLRGMGLTSDDGWPLETASASFVFL